MTYFRLGPWCHRTAGRMLDPLWWLESAARLVWSCVRVSWRLLRWLLGF